MDIRRILGISFLDLEGRILIDLLPIVRRDYKLSNYKFLGETRLLLKIYLAID